MAEDTFPPIQYVAALPGYDVLFYVLESKTFETYPVVAWGLDMVCAEAVTPMPWSGDYDRTVRGPDGVVVCGDRVWMTDSLWLAEMKANDGVPLDADKIEAVRNMPPDRTASVLALDTFRNKFRGGQ